MTTSDLPDRAWADLTSQRQLVEIHGPDSVRFLHNFCTNDIKSLAQDSGCEAFVTTDQGRTLALALVLRGPEGVYLDVGRTPARAVIEHLQRYWITERIELRDVTESLGHLIWFGHEPPGEVRDVAIVTACGGYPGTSHCWHILAAQDNRSTVVDRLKSLAGQPLGAAELERLRIQSCWPESGVEVTTDHFPQEFRLDDRAISFTKGCYLGQETVARIRSYGHVNRYLVKLTLDGQPDTRVFPIELYRDSEPVGQVTSGVSVDGQTVALGFVRRGLEQPGTKLTWSGGSAVVCE